MASDASRGCSDDVDDHLSDHDGAGGEDEGGTAVAVVAAGTTTKPAAGHGAPAGGPLRRIRRRKVPQGPSAAGRSGGRRQRAFLLWRERCVDEKRRAREVARWSRVVAPPGLLEPVFIEFD